MTIVMVYDQGYLSGGAAQIAIGEAIGLKQRGNRVIYFCGVLDENGEADKELLENDIEVICTNEEHIALTKSPKALFRGIWNDNSYQRMILLLSGLDKSQTLVHIHGWTKALSSSVIKAAYDMGFSTVITLHEYFTVCQNGGLFNYKKDSICKYKSGSLCCYLCNCDKRNYFHKIYRNIRQLMQNKILKECNPDYIYITEFSKRKFGNAILGNGNKYELTNFVCITQQNRVEVENQQVYLFIGRISAEKGIDLFCKAIDKCGVQGIVIGEGPLRKKYSAMYPNIRFVGWKNRNEQIDYLLHARALVISSKWYETMGLTAVEMQQYGIPCIVPDDCAVTEYVKHDDTGVYFKIGDVESLIIAIDKVKNNSYVKRLSENFHKSINLRRYSIDEHLSKLEIIYKSIIKNKAEENDGKTFI